MFRLGFSAPPASPLASTFPLLTQCDGCLDDCALGSWLGCVDCQPRERVTFLEAGCSQWRPLGLPGTLLPISLMQLLKHDMRDRVLTSLISGFFPGKVLSSRLNVAI